ncbi:MAG: hypothetical protein B6226_05965 [Candidatus Cloacimonetes bacterium 4572_65]|nr:MAG: hypothetical protein B6226_05965 [Candidatus Cloacimonetes bacterium 4572_65]
MVNPLLILLIPLIAGFLLSIVEKAGRKASLTIFYGVLISTFGIAVSFLVNAIKNPHEVINIATAGMSEPLSINLHVGIIEAVMMTMITFIGFISGLYLLEKFKSISIYSLILYMVLLMGLNGLIMTRDLFNTFVFLEITSIATYALITIEKNKNSLAAGFKYMLAGGIASAFILIGIILIYHVTGTLNIDSMISVKHLIVGKFGFIALFFLIFSILLELKPFPINGWAIDVYQSVSEGMGAVIAVANSTAILLVLYKVVPLLNSEYYLPLSLVGAITFVFSNLVGLKQSNAKRLLGYSSASQMGLIIFSYFTLSSYGVAENSVLMILGSFMITHFFAKAGLFYIAGSIKRKDIKDWSALAHCPGLKFFFIIFVIALSGLPPFPAFWGKWELVKILTNEGNTIGLITIVLGSLFEIGYIFRWLGFVLKGESKEEFVKSSIKIIPVALLGLILTIGSIVYTMLVYNLSYLELFPIFALLGFLLISFVPYKIRGILAIGVVSFYAYLLYPSVSGFTLFFGVTIVLSSIVYLIATLYKEKNRFGFYGLMVMLIISMGNLLVADSYLKFFLFWELMTISSYFLIIKGEKSAKSALRFVMFSMGSAFMLLVGLNLAPEISGSRPLIESLARIAFLIKTGSLGFHVWVPGAYANADDDTTGMMSAIVSKAGIFGMLLLLIPLTRTQSVSSVVFLYILGWLGAFTSLFGAIMASFQEDMKKLVAYSSISQLGYVILSLSLVSHLGWLAALHLTFNHMLFKMMIFLAIAGVIMRTGTSNMYETGGLIKKMPWSFISIAQYMPSTVVWEGNKMISGLGYWNGFSVMNITMVIFGLLFVRLLIVTRKVQKVKQFNIVFSAERPDRPETTHFAHNMYAPYRKAVGFLVDHKSATKFWNSVTEWTLSLGGVFRQFYSGNGQTYILQIILYFVVLFFAIGGK